MWKLEQQLVDTLSIVFDDSILESMDRIDAIQDLSDNKRNELIEQAEAEARAAATLVSSAAEAYPDVWFCPNGAQEKVLTTLGVCTVETKTPTIMCTYANGVGKTLLATHIVSNLLKGPQNGWFDYPIFQNFPFPKKIWYCSEPDIIIRKFIPELLRLIDSQMIKEVIHKDINDEFRDPIKYEALKEGRQYVSEIKLTNGWTIGVKSYHQGVQTFEGDDIGFIINDEPPPEMIRRAQKARRRMGCITLNIFTPLYCPPQIIDEINEHEEEMSSGERTRRTHWHLEANVYEACQRRGVRGHLDPEIIDDMVEEYSHEEREARVYGKPMFFSGRIYSQFDAGIHIVEPEQFPIKPSYIFLQIKDPHDGRLHADIWMAYTPEGRWIVFDELPTPKKPMFWDMKLKTTIKSNAKKIKFVETIWKLKLGSDIFSPRRVMDYHFGKQTRGGKLENFFMEFSKPGNDLFYEESYKVSEELIFGHNKVREALAILPDGNPGLLIWKTCVHSWQGMMHYIYKPATNKDLETKASGSNEPVARYKDFVDCIRYGICHLDYFPKQKKKKSYMVKDRLL